MSNVRDPNLGKKAKDKVTGFEGIIIGKIEYLTGCDQYGLTPPAKDGKCEPCQWFDHRRVEILGEGVSIEEVAETKDPGGPASDAPEVH